MHGRFQNGTFNYNGKFEFEEDVDLDCYIFNTKFGFGQDYSSFLELINSIGCFLYKRNMNDELKKTLMDMISIFNKIEGLVYERDGSYGGIKIDLDDMIKKLESFKFEPGIFVLRETLKKHKIKKLSDSEYTEYENYKNLRFSERIKATKPNVLDYLNYVKEDNGIKIFSDEDFTGWGLITPKNDDANVFKSLLKMFSLLDSLPKDCSLSDGNFEHYGWVEVTDLTLHKEVIQSVNMLLRAFKYLLNSSSYRENEYYIYDRIEVENGMKVSKVIFERTVEVLKSQRNMR